MDTRITRSNDLFNFDAGRDGYDTNILKAITGTPTLATNKVQINNADVTTYVSTRNCTVDFLLNVPVAPTTAQDKTWGLKGVNDGLRGATFFNIAGAVFSAKVYDSAGTLLFSRHITWSSAWTATDTRYKILITERNVIFSIEDTIVADFGSDSGKIFNNFTHCPEPVRITNVNADNLLLSVLKLY